MLTPTGIKITCRIVLVVLCFRRDGEEMNDY